MIRRHGLRIGAAALLFLLAPSPRVSAETPPTADLLATLAMLEDTRCPDGRQVAIYLKEDFPPPVRERAALALARLQDSTTVEDLADRLRRDESVGVRREVAFALGQVGHKSGREALEAALDSDADVEVRALAVEALGKLGDRRATPACVRALSAGDPRVRREGAIALWRLADSTAITPLVKALREPDAGVRAMIVWALEKTVAPQRIVRDVGKLSGDESPLVRSYVARTLGRQGSSLGTAPLLALSADRDPHVRVNACRALGQVADSTAVPQLLARLEDPEPHVREVAVGTLGRLRERSIAGRLAALRRDREQAVRAATADALAELLPPDQAWPLLQPLLVDRVERVRARAYEVLGRVDRPEAVTALTRCLEGRGRGKAASGVLERAAAATALAKLKARSARPALVRALSERDAGLVSSVADALGEMGDRDSTTVRALLEAIRANASPNEPDVLVSGLEAMGKLKAEQGVPLATEQLVSPQPRVREAARGLLASVLGDSAAHVLERAQGSPPWKASSIEGYRNQIPDARTAVIRTSRGEVAIELFAEDAPLTVANFARLARKGFFDRHSFHRVVPNFVVQDGDPTGTGWGGPGYAIRCEYNRRRYGVGTLGMALSGKDTGGSQWFLTHSPQPHLDGRYTVFGQVVKGFDVLERITLGDAIVKITVSSAAPDARRSGIP